MFNIEDLRAVNTPQNIIITQHSRIRLSERGISVDDIINTINTINTINNGEIIEEYPEDFPFPSCLIIGTSLGHRYLHVVVSLNEDFINLITAYYPDPKRWDETLKIRKDKEK